MSDYTEEFICNECGHEWVLTGDTACPACGSDNTQPVEPEVE